MFTLLRLLHACMHMYVPANAYVRVRLLWFTVSPAHVDALAARVRHSVAIYGQLLLFCDQSMREKAWCSRKSGA